MERNMELVLKILRGVRASKGDGSGYTYVVSHEHGQIIHANQPDSVLLPVDLCPDCDTLYYHIALMGQADLIETTKGGYGGYPVCRLTWNGHDFLQNADQDGVIEHIEAKYGGRWRDWSLDVMKTVFVEVAKQMALKPLL